MTDDPRADFLNSESNGSRPLLMTECCEDVSIGACSADCVIRAEIFTREDE